MPKAPDTPQLPASLLEAIAAGTFDETGETFFDQLVKQLALALGTRFAWVTEWLEAQQRLRALSFWSADSGYRQYETSIAGTPCEIVIEDRRLVHFPDRVIELFPDDPDLPPLEAVSYMGVPLQDTDGRVLGHLAVLHNEVFPESPEAAALLKIFAGRAAAELRRLKRDRALQERELRLRALVGSAIDGIIELDRDFRVTAMNPAAVQALACTECDVSGHLIDEFLAAPACQTLHTLLRSLEPGVQGQDSLWIADGLAAVARDGTGFHAEATISCYAFAGERCYTLFLRNVDERVEAEARIEALLDQTASLRAEIDSLQGFGEIIGRSKAIRNVLRDVKAVADCDAAVLITGETGTGKERFAAAIHEHSARKQGPFVKVNCAAIPANLQESEFFGHERGAFTGATQRRDGRFRQAHGGTIFLDEVGELPPDLQAKLLRVLQEGEFQTVGGANTVKVDVRVIAATNRDLAAMVQAGTFRMDLLYRLNVFPIQVPPLRERGNDILLLAHAFARRAAARRGWEGCRIAPEDERRLLAYDWPGNVRELENVMERAIITARDGRTLNLARALPEVRNGSAAPPPSSRETPSEGVESSPDTGRRILTATELRELERDNIQSALAASHGKVAGGGGAAELLGMNPNTLASRMKSLGIRR